MVVMSTCFIDTRVWTVETYVWFTIGDRRRAAAAGGFGLVSDSVGDMSLSSVVFLGCIHSSKPRTWGTRFSVSSQVVIVVILVFQTGPTTT